MRLAGARVGAAAALLGVACSLGEGTGTTSGVLDAPLCWSGCFDLRPDFFAAVPDSPQVQIRIQNGGDFETFSDGLAILVDDVGAIRGDPLPSGMTRPSFLGQTLAVGLPPAVRPSGVPVVSVANPPTVHATLYLERSCRTQNVALYAVNAVTLNPDGTCTRPDGGAESTTVCPASDGGVDASATTDASTTEGGPPAVTTEPSGGVSCEPTATQVGASTIVFDDLFDGNADESNAKQRLTQAHFDFYLADPREICPGGMGPPPRCRGHIAGNFKFYFQRGRPAQPFP